MASEPQPTPELPVNGVRTPRQTCLDVCLTNGWQPESRELDRLVGIWHEVRSGHRSTMLLSPNKLGFARWLVEHGRLSEGVEEGPISTEASRTPLGQSPERR